MRKTILLAGIVTASAVIVVSFFMPWAKADGSVVMLNDWTESPDICGLLK